MYLRGVWGFPYYALSLRAREAVFIIELSHYRIITLSNYHITS
jgi:hypothetical protein